MAIPLLQSGSAPPSLRRLSFLCVVALLSPRPVAGWCQLGGLQPKIATQAIVPCRASCNCGPTVRVVSVGKTKERWLQVRHVLTRPLESARMPTPWTVDVLHTRSQDALAEYMKRLSVVALECNWVRDDAALVDSARGRCIVLDERGELYTSKEFSRMMFDALEDGGSRLTFIIGAADGLPDELRNGPHQLLSLSRMTFTHQMARLLLVEQIYRACEIQRGSKYHRE
eukprot:6194180-Pleurochrysis_carterae.AAC.2